MGASPDRVALHNLTDIVLQETRLLKTEKRNLEKKS
jgi:hypothetical protein